MTLDHWERHAGAVLNREESEAGIATLQDSASLIVGLFIYRVDHDPDHGATFVVDDFVALDILSPQTVAEHLARAMESTARGLGCKAVHTAVPCTEGSRPPYLVDMLHALGHRLESLRLCKALPAVG
jgi:hypothetical protein